MGIQSEIDRIEEGKAQIAQAITAKGVETASDASFNTITENIEKISAIPDGVKKITLSTDFSHAMFASPLLNETKTFLQIFHCLKLL